MFRNRKPLVFGLSILLCLTALMPLTGVIAAAADGTWVAAWSTSIVDSSVSPLGLNLRDIIPARSTLRTEITLTVGGSELEFVFSNRFGNSPITINAASVAKTDGAGAAKIVNGTQTFITFNGGQVSVTIPAGETVTSDRIPFVSEPLEKVSVSTFFKDMTYMTSSGLSNGRTFMRTNLFDSDARVNAVTLTGRSEVNITSSTITYHTIPFLETVNTCNPSPYACTAVFIGDSTLVNDTFLYYAERVTSTRAYNIAVVNKAIIGNKLLSDGSGLIGNLYGIALRDRFENDVLRMKGVKYCFVKIGLNDILHQFSKSLSAATPKYTTDQIINGYRELIARCHAHGIKIYFFSKSPWKGYARSFLGQGTDLEWNREAQNMCDALNTWILNNNEADGAIDCSPLADPSEPTRLCPSFTLDGAHLTDLGSIALADLIPVEFVGLTSASSRSAADIAGADPYAEKRQILANMASSGTNNGSSNSRSSNNSSSNNSSSNNSSSNSSSSNNNGSNRSNSAGTTAPSSSTPATTKAPAVTAPATTTPAATVPAATQPSYESFTVYETPAGVYNEAATADGYSAQEYYNPDIPNGQDVQYVSDSGSKQNIGSGTAVVVVLIILTVMLAVGTVVILTIGRRKEDMDN